MNAKEFANYKCQVLKAKDLSKKGDIDQYIQNLVELVNAQEDYVTLSSCSGRSIVIQQNSNDKHHKKGCKWIYSTHSVIDENEFHCEIEANKEDDLIMKFEPFILHVGCSSLTAAKKMLTCALDCGYRNSGIVIGKHDKVTLAIRSTLNLEAPVSFNQHFVSDEYLKHLINLADGKMRDNLNQCKRFEENLKEMFK